MKFTIEEVKLMIRSVDHEMERMWMKSKETDVPGVEEEWKGLNRLRNRFSLHIMDFETNLAARRAPGTPPAPLRLSSKEDASCVPLQRPSCRARMVP